MNEGVKILLARMETNPEEFLDKGKWKSLIEGYASYLNPDDYKLIREELNKLHQQRFTEEVMKELLAPEEDDDMGKYFKANVAHATLPATLTPSPSIPNISIERKAQINAMKVQVRKKATLKKQHETLYGKLKNYLHSDT